MVSLEIFNHHECKTASSYEILVKDSEMTKKINPTKMADINYILTTVSSEICKPPCSMRTELQVKGGKNKFLQGHVTSPFSLLLFWMTFTLVQLLSMCLIKWQSTTEQTKGTFNCPVQATGKKLRDRGD